MLENIDDWEQNNHYITNNKTGIKVWTANGFMFFDTYPHTNAFSFLDKLRFVRFRYKWNALKLARTLEKK